MLDRSVPLTIQVQQKLRGSLDAARVQGYLDALRREVLDHFGRSLVVTAKRSMRVRKKPSPPGTPPSVHDTSGGIKNLIEWSFAPNGQGIIAGPKIKPRSSMAQRTNEFGGAARVRNPRRWVRGRPVVRTIGSGGEIRIGGKFCPTTKPIPAIKLPGGQELAAKYGTIVGIPVTYARIRTAGEAARANAILEELYGPLTYPAQYPPRPYMRPAFAKTTTNLPKFIQQAANKVARRLSRAV